MALSVSIEVVPTYEDFVDYFGQSVRVVCDLAADPDRLSRELRRAASDVEARGFSPGSANSWSLGVLEEGIVRLARPPIERLRDGGVANEECQWFVRELSNGRAFLLVGEWSSVELACALIRMLADWLDRRGIPTCNESLVALDPHDEINEALWPPSNDWLSDFERERRARLLRRNGFDPTEYGYR